MRFIAAEVTLFSPLLEDSRSEHLFARYTVLSALPSNRTGGMPQVPE